MFQGIDLYSDTVTKPTPGMRQAIAQAVVGDEQRGEDPTTLALERKVAEMLGGEEAMYVPSATMANEIAVQLHCLPGDEIIASETCHLICSEVGGAAVHGRAMCRGLISPNGIFTAQQVEEAIRPSSRLSPRSAMVHIENTANLAGGVPWPLESIREVMECARRHGLRLHLDGARLMNAAVATSVSARELAFGFDTVTLCLSKGLGAPMGALLVSKREYCERARRLKHMMGGALRQSGMMAAAGLYALQNHLERLREDHENARRLAEGLSQIEGITVENNPPATNMVFFSVHSPLLAPHEFLDRLRDHGLRFSQPGRNRFRGVTHLDISREQIEKAIDIMRAVFSREIIEKT